MLLLLLVQNILLTTRRVELFSTPSRSLQHQPGVLASNAVLTLSAWRWSQVTPVKGSVQDCPHFTSPACTSDQPTSSGPLLGFSLLEQLTELGKTFIGLVRGMIKGQNNKMARDIGREV